MNKLHCELKYLDKEVRWEKKFVRRDYKKEGR